MSLKTEPLGPEAKRRRRLRSLDSGGIRLRPRSENSTAARLQKAARARLLEPLVAAPTDVIRRPRGRPPKAAQLVKRQARSPGRPATKPPAARARLALGKRKAAAALPQPEVQPRPLSPYATSLFDSLGAAYSDVGVELPDLKDDETCQPPAASARVPVAQGEQEGGQGLINIEDRPELQSITIKIPKRYFDFRKGGQPDQGSETPPSGAFSYPGAWRPSSRSASVAPQLHDAPPPRQVVAADANLQASDGEEEVVEAPLTVPSRPLLAVQAVQKGQTEAQTSTESVPCSDRASSPVSFLPSTTETSVSTEAPQLSLSGMLGTTDVPPALQADAIIQTTASTLAFPPRDAQVSVGASLASLASTSVQAIPASQDFSGQAVPSVSDQSAQAVPSKADMGTGTEEEKVETREPTPPVKEPSPTKDTVSPLAVKTEPSPCGIPLVPSPPNISEAVKGLLMLAGKAEKAESVRRSEGGPESLLQSLPPHFAHLIAVHTHPNGGASVLRCKWSEVRASLSPSEMSAFADAFIDVGLTEQSGAPVFSMAIVEGGAVDIPDPLSFIANATPGLPVKIGSLTNKQKIETTTIGKYRDEVMKTYEKGTFRHGPMHALSVVGTTAEECGDYYPAYLAALEASPFLKPLLPWGELAKTKGIRPSESNDGPIVWTRPGEQLIPTSGSGRRGGGGGRRELGSLYTTLRTWEKRETMFEDRTPCHADHVGDGLERKTTAAVGLLKALSSPGDKGGRQVKDVVAFSGANFARLVDELQLDLYEPPMTQCVQWVEEAKLNGLSREGVAWTRLSLADDDLYFLPRNIIHQFRTTAAVTSVAWHVQLSRYYE